ncbi:COG3650 family protein [Cochlodiniinecator piscidefendens]|uniref:COG3650 family protein n=1 Tax=Cochlodiniinecator piscidefendens TaxID=2715756 RepID=UPI001408B496|nr:SH3 domain-containing protein [Cochlodiniinecator piscidefendens]
MKHVVWIFLAFFAVPVFAQEWELPALYDVSGVVANDVLNVREAPTGSAPIVSSLRPNQTDIEVLHLSDDQRWARVALDEISGWASVSFLTRQPGQTHDQITRNMICSGTEPFWGLAFLPNSIVEYDDIIADGPTQMTEVRRNVAASRQSFPLVIQVQNGDKSAEIILTRQYCSDGMSDRDYGFAALFISDHTPYERRVLEGCCRLGN